MKSHLVAALAALSGTHACTNILVSKGASADGSTQIAYNADSGNLFGSLGFYAAADHNNGTMRDVWDWDASTYLGQIPEAAHTFNVVGNANEHGLIIGETTFGGLPQLDGHGSSALIDYGSLIWITLQRAKTAREAIALMDHLCQTYGYASDGESFSVADQNEVWLVELIGKGQTRGAVWVAHKVPEGFIGSTANQARTQAFDWNDSENVLYAEDVCSFAQGQKLYPATSDCKDFSFSDTYDPVTFSGVRLGEARVWNIFNPVTEGGFAQYLDYAKGYNLTNRMPLFAQPTQKLAVNDTMHLMRTHFEGTWFDNSGHDRRDVGAGPGESPYRWRPLGWESGGKSYVNERTVGVQQTGWAFVAQSRSWMPDALAALFWFAPDESSTAVRIPIYGGATAIPPSYADRFGQQPAAATDDAVGGDAYTMSLDSAFWVYNLVANIAYGERYREAYPLIQAEINKYQGRFIAETKALDAKAAALFKSGDEAGAIKLVTDYGVKTGDQMTKDWLGFWMQLFSRFRDGFTVTAPKTPVCDLTQKPSAWKGCTARPVPDAATSGYSDAWYARIVADDTQHHYAVPAAHVEAMRADPKLAALDARKRLRMDKMRRR